METSARKNGQLTLMFTCVGRRIELLQAFRSAARRLGVDLRIIGLDCDPTAPALVCADIAVLAPPIASPGYLAAVRETAAHYRVAAIIPTIDTDLPTLSANRDLLDSGETLTLIGDAGTIRTCRDKLETYRLLTAHGIDAPATYTPAEVRSRRDLTFPLFCKPRGGSASQRIRKLNDAAELEFYLGRDEDLIVQEFVAGDEYTLDVYVGLTGTPRCVVPRKRLEVRAGEVSKGVVLKDPQIMEAGRRVGEALGRSPRGLLTIQCIVTPDRRIRFIEINPRFGGGAPLGIAAGADYPGWLLQELRGEVPEIAFDGFQHGLCMLRYDWSVLVALEADLKPRIGPPLRPFPEFE